VQTSFVPESRVTYIAPAATAASACAEVTAIFDPDCATFDAVSPGRSGARR
jgi:hypothetical protein